MKRQTQILIGCLILAFLVAAAWAARKIRVSPPASGESYRVVRDWPQLPVGVVLGQVSGVDLDSKGNVYVFHRANRIWSGEEFGLDLIQAPTLLIFDGETGRLLESRGADMFVLPHGLTIDQDDNLWLTDVGLHQVFKFDPEGNLLMTLGEHGVKGSDESHFNQPTDVAVAADGSFYVSDGYGNSRVMKFSPDGKFLMSWGSAGSDLGQFDTPHSIALDSFGNVYVADRGNARLQIFSPDGIFINEWKGPEFGRPWAVRVDLSGNVYIVDGGDQLNLWPDRARILKFDPNGNLLASFGSSGTGPGQFIWPHTIALGKSGELYVGEVSTGMRIQKFAPQK
jgi:peptidylamidoglycolate lyase